MDSIFAEHLRRLRTSVLAGFSLKQIPEWITKNTTLKGHPFSYDGHEYQLEIVRDQSPLINVRKCSQIGITELSVRAALAMTNIMEGFTVIYTMPTANQAKTFMQTRVNPIIQGSQELKYRLNKEMDNTEVKQFDMSFFYCKGTVGQGAAISVPADALIHDELDFSENEVVTSYQSRLTHSPYKITWKFSTPTVNGLGISREMDVSRRHILMCKCNHCNEWFLPDYFLHVRIPNFRGALTEISKDNLHLHDYKNAWVECPKCGGRPDLNIEHRQWVVENSDDQFDASGYQISPFDAPRVITVGDLIQRSTLYDRYVDFVNFALGKPAEDKDSSITKEDIDACYVPGQPTTFMTHVMGIDMGLICHFMIAGVDALGRMVVVKTVRVPLAEFDAKYNQFRRQYRVMMTVMDTNPYVDTVMRLQKVDPNLYGALYVDLKEITPFVLKKKDEEKKEGKLDVRQVSVNRNKALDSLMMDVRTGQVFICEDENRHLVTEHLQDMKRVKDFTMHHELSYVWKKTSGRDHFHHAMLYCWIASKLRGVSVGASINLPLAQRMKLKQQVA